MTVALLMRLNDTLFFLHPSGDVGSHSKERYSTPHVGNRVLMLFDG